MMSELISFITVTTLFAVLLLSVLSIILAPAFTKEDRLPQEDVTIWYKIRMYIQSDYSKAECGCVYLDEFLMTREPGREVVTGDLAESNKYWKRTKNGAKWDYSLYKEELNRCTCCGDFLFVEEEMAPLISVWPEESLPDKVADSNHPIRE